MSSLRKIVARWSWLSAVIGFLLLAQMQQVIACDIMSMPPAKAGQHCAMPHSGIMQMAQAKKAYCDFLFKFSTAGQCHNDPGVTISPSLSGKLQPDYHPVLITANLQDIFPYPQSPPLVLAPDRGSSRPGIQTYLITQRLRI